MTGPPRPVPRPEPPATAVGESPNTMYPNYPPGTAHRLLATDLVTPKTREVLAARIAAHAAAHPLPPRFFTCAEFTTLEAVCARLIPQPDREHPIDLAGAIDQRLADGKTDGWRYDNMPPDGEAYRRALGGIDDAAAAMSNRSLGHSLEARFATLGAARQDAVLLAVQRGEAPGAAWKTMSATRFFEELLAEVVESYYSHPLAEDEIGYGGFADAHGWQRIGLDQLEPFEPRAFRDAHRQVSGRAPGAPNG